MTPAPLIHAGPSIITHVIAAVTALGLGAVQLLRRKGTPTHRLIGWLWVVLLGVVALGSFGIHKLRQFGPFSFIHVISVFTLAMLVLAVLQARAGRVEAHKWTMISLFFCALVITGLFTLLPGRLMHGVFFGR